MFQCAVYPRTGHTGYLQQQGQVIASVQSQMEQRFPGATIVRILWNHLVFLLQPRLSHEEVIAAAKDLAMNETEEVEVRAAWCSVDGPRSSHWFDEFLGELSARRNFGSCAWIEGRLMGGKITLGRAD